MYLGGGGLWVSPLKTVRSGRSLSTYLKKPDFGSRPPSILDFGILVVGVRGQAGFDLGREGGTYYRVGISPVNSKIQKNLRLSAAITRGPLPVFRRRGGLPPARLQVWILACRPPPDRDMLYLTK